MHSRSDSNFSDLNQVLQHNLNINNANLDADGNINNEGGHRRGGQNDDGNGSDDEGQYEDNQDGKERVNKIKLNIERYFK